MDWLLIGSSDEPTLEVDAQYETTTVACIPGHTTYVIGRMFVVCIGKL